MFSSTNYRGVRTANGIDVWRERDGIKSHLPPRLDLRNHSPTGLEWGYGGSGPAQLALAILADALGNDSAANQFHQAFKWRFVANFAHESWTITAEQVIAWFTLRCKPDGSIDEAVGDGQDTFYGLYQAEMD